jgi:hypothetical protein
MGRGGNLVPRSGCADEAISVVDSSCCPTEVKYGRATASGHGGFGERPSRDPLAAAVINAIPAQQDVRAV